VSCDCNNHGDSPSFSFAKQSLSFWFEEVIAMAMEERPCSQLDQSGKTCANCVLKKWHKKQLEQQLEVVTPSTTGGVALIGAYWS